MRGLILAPLITGTLRATPVGIAANNPGNISPRHLRYWRGAIGYDAWGHARFRTRADGIRAIRKNLLDYWRLHRIDTVDAIVHRWISSKSQRENPVQVRGYERGICHVVGAAPFQRLDMTSPDTLEALAIGITIEENGCQPYPQWLFDEIFQGSR